VICDQRDRGGEIVSRQNTEGTSVEAVHSYLCQRIYRRSMKLGVVQYRHSHGVVVARMFDSDVN
jgi:hypothetical protein